ncbi:MAG: hypothetical protein AAGF12_12785, partial [Myxococcota bacterium]
RKYGPPLLRVSAFLLCVYLAVLGFLMHQARAQVSEVLMGLGVEMLRYEGAEYQEAPRTLYLNGQRILMATGIANHSLDRVLDFYESRCMDHDGELGEQIAELMSADPDVGDIDSSLLDATLREASGSKGFVACLDTGRDRLEQEALAERVDRYRRYADVSELGDMRYIYAEESDGTTLFVTFWTEGSFKIAEMFPEEGDAPGQDVDGVPRPPNARRILSAWEQGHPQSFTMYLQEGTGASLEEFYRGAMDDWTLMEIDPSRLADLPDGVVPGMEQFLIYERGDRMVSLAFVEDDRGRTTTTILTH